MSTTTARATEPFGRVTHWLALEHKSTPQKEEVYPLLDVDLPRVGVVSVEVEASRYVASFYDKATSTSTDGWTDWRIITRRIEPEHGVGEKGRALIREAVEPVVREWLASDAYRDSAAQALFYAVKRELDERTLASYTIERARKTIAANRAGLTPADADRLMQACDLIEQASALLETSAS